jgi:hypothetical protein
MGSPPAGIGIIAGMGAGVNVTAPGLKIDFFLLGFDAPNNVLDTSNLLLKLVGVKELVKLAFELL